jgi:acetyl esterase/lipase
MSVRCLKLLPLKLSIAVACLISASVGYAEDTNLKPTYADIKYGDHKLQAFDLWLSRQQEGNTSTPLCIFIHGGGFKGGDKTRLRKPDIERFLENGISFASMNYRLTEGGKFPYPAAMHDCVRGLQVLRSKAQQWNIDPKRIACYGGSAGAGISLWLAFHDDMADKESNDPIARQSTRIVAAGALAGQSTYDMRTFREWFNVPGLPPHNAISDFYGMKQGETADSPRIIELARDASPINHLTADDPPVYMFYSHPAVKVTAQTPQNIWVHHPLLGLKLQQAMKKLEIECTVVTPDIEDTRYKDIADFLVRKLTEESDQ